MLCYFSISAGGRLHAMDCTDIIIVGARGATHRIRDYYTRDRSSPQEDTVYGGEYSLTDAIASERDGITLAIFRRKLVSRECEKKINVDVNLDKLYYNLVCHVTTIIPFTFS